MNYLGLFLQTATQNIGEELMTIILGMFIFIFILAIALYVYLSLAFMKIGQRADLSSPGLAWVPGIGPLIIAFKASKMHWWPWLLLPIAYIDSLFPDSTIIFILSLIVFIVWFVYTIIWDWKMFERIGRPGWWALTVFILPVFIILVGVAAWGSGSEDFSSLEEKYQYPYKTHNIR